VQVEINKTMHEKTATGYETGKLQCPGEGIVELAQSF